MRLIDVVTSPWAIQPKKLSEIISIYGAHVRGERADISAIEAQIGKPLANKRVPYEVIDGVAVIPVEGVLAKKMNMLMEISGGTSTQLLMKDFNSALADESVESILLHVDSPGGTVDGTQDLAGMIHRARGIKPVIALADGMMASAAYWIGAAADAVYITSETTMVGSIGVVAAHHDWSKYDENLGVRTTEIYAGKYKRIYSEHKPLSEEGRQTIQESVDYIYSIFVGAVAEYRGVSTETVLETMADGKVFIGRQAVDAGLVDGIAGFEEIVKSMVLRQAQQPGMANSERANDDSPLRISGNSNDNNSTTLNLNHGRTVMSKETGSDVQAAAPVTVESIRAGNPEVAGALYNEGYAAGMAEGKTKGAAAESHRIAEVEAQSMPGHEKLIASLKFDGKTTGPEAAVQVLAAEKQANAKVLTELEEKSPEVVPPSMYEGGAEKQAAGDSSDEATLRKNWDADANLRGDFMSFEDYTAYMQADKAGRVKYYKKPE